MRKLLERLRQQLLRLVAEDVTEAPAHPEKPTLVIDVGDPDGGMIRRHAVALLALQQSRPLGAPLGRDSAVRHPPEEENGDDHRRKCPENVRKDAGESEEEQRHAQQRGAGSEAPRETRPVSRRVHLRQF